MEISELKDFILIIFGAFIGALSFLVKEAYCEIRGYFEKKRRFSYFEKNYEPIIAKIKEITYTTPSKVIEYRSGDQLYIISHNNKPKPIIAQNINKKYHAGTFLADLYRYKFVYQLDLDTSPIVSGSIGRVGSRSVKYVFSENFMEEISKSDNRVS